MHCKSFFVLEYLTWLQPRTLIYLDNIEIEEHKDSSPRRTHFYYMQPVSFSHVSALVEAVQPHLYESVQAQIFVMLIYDVP